jgi:hypothetical protein
LKIHPEACGGVEIASEAQGRVGGDGAALVNDFRDTGDRDTQIEGKTVHAEAERLEIILTKNLARMDGGKKFFSASHDRLLVIINNLDVERISILPSEADPPLIVDANAVLARAVPFQGFPSITRRRSEVAKFDGTVELAEFPPSHLL